MRCTMVERKARYCGHETNESLIVVSIITSRDWSSFVYAEANANNKSGQRGAQDFRIIYYTISPVLIYNTI